MLSFEPAGIKRALFAVCVSIGLTISSAAISKQKPEPEPPVIWDMDDIKPPTLIEPDPDGMPAVVSAGTPSMSREEAIQIKNLVDQEDLLNTALINGDMTEEEAASIYDLGGVSTMSASYNPTYDSCTGPQKILCAYDEVYRFYYVDFIPSSGATALIAKTQNLTRLRTTDTNTPDTMLYLLKCNDDYCTSGDVIAIDDNDNTDTASAYDSRISAMLFANSHYRIVVVDKYQGSEGTADLSLKFGNYNEAVISKVAAGGWHVRNKTVKYWDSLFVGKNSNSSTAGFVENRQYHDSTLLYITTSSVNCDSSCGKFLFNDDHVVGNSPMVLSKIRIPIGYQSLSGGGRVIVGVVDSKSSSGDWIAMNARLFHYRRSTVNAGLWSGSANYNDNDGDGLSWELENLLGSCDLITDAPSDGVGIQGMSCQDYADRVGINTWSPTDSDNDGINDDAEVFSIAVHCTQTPVSPYYDAGTCTKFGLHESPSCPTGQYCIGVDVSALSDPNPNVYDVYVFNDYIKSGSTEYRISSTGQEYLKRGWHDASISCWDGSAAPCEGEQDHPYLINAHVYSTQGAGLPVTRHDFVDGVFGEELGGGRVWVRAYFNQFLKPEFKYTGVGIYTLGNFDGGGQATVSGRSLTWGLASVTDGGERRQTDVLLALSHEIGHCLGIEDLTTKKSGYPPESSVICRELYNPSTEEE